MRNVSDKNFRENQDKHFTFSKFSESRAVYNLEKCGRARQVTDNNVTKCMRFACSISNAKSTHSQI